MIYTVELLRQKDRDSESYRQTIEYDVKDDSMNVASLLRELNMNKDLKDIKGNPAEEIKWECSCLQKKCGSCAMRINRVPSLACSTLLSSFKKRRIILEPLKKFPVVTDLIVDRSIMQENLKTIAQWFEKNVSVNEKTGDTAYEASRCLQCGCCLEVCPNFLPGDDFFSAAAFVPFTRILAEQGERDDLKNRLYDLHVYKGCGKSLSCRDICPAKIDTERLLVNSNAIAIWKRHLSKC